MERKKKVNLMLGATLTDSTPVRSLANTKTDRPSSIRLSDEPDLNYTSESRIARYVVELLNDPTTSKRMRPSQ